MRRLALVVLLLTMSAVAQATPATVVQPRPYGYLVGDLFEQRVLLEADSRTVELQDLPGKDRLGVWILRRGARVERDHDGRRWLRLDYQVINASKDIDRFILPAYSLKGKGGAILDVPEWPMTAGAIVQQLAGDDPGLPLMQPDTPAPQLDVVAPRRRLQRSLVLVAMTLIAWAGWWRWREWLAARKLPFARAQFALARLGPETVEAWRCLHRAFDETAGLAVSRETLPALFARAPQFAAARAEIEAFFIASEQRFFGGQHLPFEREPVRALCRRLRALERSTEP